MNFKPPYVYKRRDTEYEYVLYDAIDHDRKSFGLMYMTQAHVLIEVQMLGNRCLIEYDDEYIIPLDHTLQISGEQMHLFVQ